MSDAFLKSLRWCFLSMCVIMGASAFMISEEKDTMKPIMLGILCFGIVYILSVFWKEFRDKLLIASVAVFFVFTALSNIVPDAMFVLFGFDRDYFNIYYTWAGTVAICGTPVMWLVFYKFD